MSRVIGTICRLHPAALSGAPGARQAGVLLRRDFQDYGLGRVAGTVKEKGTPDFVVYRRVRLFVKAGARQIRETWSDATTGAYAFDFVALGVEYFVLAHDHTGHYNAVVKDSIFAEPMP